MAFLANFSNHKPVGGTRLMDPKTLIGSSSAMLDLLELTSRLAPLTKPVVIWGERGTGKELICERLHFLSQRWDKPLIKVNCAALNDNMLESDLFGHEAGAFTGAQQRRHGKFQRADGGTIFLDEIASASPRLQEKLLRLVEYGEYEPLGSQQTLQVDVRIIAATNENLGQLSQENKFRADLLDRLSFEVVQIPPLRERSADIINLAEHFAISFTARLKRELFSGFTPQAKQDLLGYPWPGNVRELRATVERSVFRQPDANRPVAKITFSPFAVAPPAANSLPAPTPREQGSPPAAPHAPYDFNSQVAAYEKSLLRASLHTNGFNQTQTAKDLQLSYHQLRNYLRKYPEILLTKTPSAHNHQQQTT